jgi:flagella basal body P-ring formation protein FlgA
MPAVDAAKMRGCRRVQWLLALCSVAACAFGWSLPCSAAEASVIDLPVAISTIFPGSPISEEQLTEKRFRSAVARGNVVLRRQDIVGKVARRVILAGQPIPTMVLKEVELIAAGAPVILFFASDGVEISGRGVALQAGKMGEFISVRNVDTGIVVKAFVEAQGRVRVGQI